MRPVRRLMPLLLITCVLSACDSNDNDNVLAPAPDPGGQPGAQRGALLENPPPRTGSFSGTEILARIASGDLGAEFIQLFDTPDCSVDVYQLRYQTVGAQDESTTASGALMLPVGDSPDCQGGRPIVVYAHGTTELRSFNIANLDSEDNFEGLLIAAVFAAQGYIVVAPNYAGYDSSTLGYHPYLNADQQSKDVIDALTAARTAISALGSSGVTDGGKLFITGYSQGGYVAMATHKALQAALQPVTASAPMSGPYALAAFGDAIFQGQVSLDSPLNLTLLFTSYQRAFENVFSATTDVFEAQYATGIDTLLPSTVDDSTLYAQGLLPRHEVFSNVPPDPAFAAFTPATMPVNLAPVFARGFGPNNLITNSYRLGYLQDAQANPDGGFPNTTTGVPAANPAHPLRQALKANDLRNWTPSSPVLLCAGNSDPTVFYLNTQLMQGFWAANAPTAPVTVLDVDSPAASGDPFADLKSGFAALKNLVAATAVAEGATDGGQLAVLDAYHAGLVPPFCLSAVKSFFDGL